MHPPKRSRPPRRGRTARIAGMVAVLSATCALAACGDDGVEEPGASAASVESEQQSAMLRFAQCMRGQGVDYPDPRADGSVTLTDGLGPQAEAATRACRRHLPETSPPTPRERKQTTDAMLALAKCLRANGGNVTDPVTDDSGDVSFSGSELPPAAVQECGPLYDKAGLQRPSE